MRAILISLLLALPAMAERLPADLTRAQQDAVNAEVDVAFTALETAQADWMAGDARRRYVQVLSRAVKSDGTATRLDDRVETTPSDRSETLTTLGISTSRVALCDYVLGEYEGTLGKGHLMHCELELSVVVWRRTRHVGPEVRGFTDSDIGWYQVIVDEG